jgi:hypothetical protein
MNDKEGKSKSVRVIVREMEQCNGYGGIQSFGGPGHVEKAVSGLRVRGG